MSVTTTPGAARLEQDNRSLGELERDFCVDPWHFLRRACQAADYDIASTAPTPSSSPRAAE
jgi:hypothetical protein